MKFSRALLLRRHRSIWREPQRALATLESFAATEEDGGRDLEAAARRAGDPELRGHLERHARDEVRHAALFRARAAELALTARDESRPDKPYDLSRGRRAGELDAHGFLNAGLLGELGEVEYVAMLHVAERRAAELFEVHAALTTHDPRTRAVFEEILRDEKYHVAYTGRFLERWRAEGREREVERALGQAKMSRLRGGWERLGARSGAGFARVLLLAFYWTALVPFGLVSRRREPASGWRTPRPAGDTRAQF